jgi:hypothetical protein
MEQKFKKFFLQLMTKRITFLAHSYFTREERKKAKLAKAIKFKN